MKYVKTILMMIALWGLISSTMQAQCPVSMTVSYTPVQHLGLADVDLEHFESSALLFSVHIDPGESDAWVRLNVQLMITLADGTTYPDAVVFSTECFAVPHGEGKTITNSDIGNTREIKTASFQYNHDAKDRIQDIALATGSFPAGRYVFHIALEQVSAPPLCSVILCTDGSKDVEYLLQNPSRVELRSPRDGEVTSDFPFFEFYDDADRVTLTVVELPTAASREDAITRKPPMLEVDLQGQNSFLYAGGRPLEQGKSYAWQVVSKSRLAGGTDNLVASPIWTFTVSNAGEGASVDAILNQLEEMFGARYSALFAQIRSGNFKLSGKYSDNNSSLTQSDLLKLLNELRDAADGADLSFE